MDFSDALRAAKTGTRIARTGWHGTNMHVRVATVDGTEPFLAIQDPRGHVYPWVTSQADVLADDWELVGTDGRPGQGTP